MYSNYTIIIYMGVHHEEHIFHIFIALLTGPNCAFNQFINNLK